jgi:hypothetical protein
LILFRLFLLQLVTCVQDSDAKQRQARAVVESKRLVDQHVFSVQKEAAKADAHLQKQQEDIRDCMVLNWILFGSLIFNLIQ